MFYIIEGVFIDFYQTQSTIYYQLSYLELSHFYEKQRYVWKKHVQISIWKNQVSSRNLKFDEMEPRFMTYDECDQKYGNINYEQYMSLKLVVNHALSKFRVRSL